MTTYLFVYNADSGFFNTVKDTLHKVVSPKTYECNLCKITYGPISMKARWKAFISSLDARFLHKDEFEKHHPPGKYPCVYKQEGEKLTLLISQEEMNAVRDLDELITLMKKKLK
jgi:hypothetical protein